MRQRRLLDFAWTMDDPAAMPDRQTPKETLTPGARLRRWRLASGYTQEWCARVVGGSMAAWSEWESGKKSPVSIDVLVALELLTGIPMEAWSRRSETPRMMGQILQRRKTRRIADRPQDSTAA